MTQTRYRLESAPAAGSTQVNPVNKDCSPSKPTTTNGDRRAVRVRPSVSKPSGSSAWHNMPNRGIPGV